MRKIKIEIISGLLSAVMILSSLPVTVFAGENTAENTVSTITSEIIASEPSTETEVVYEETETEPIDENVTSIPEDETGSSQVDLDEDIDPLIDETTETSEATEETTETSETTEAPAELIVFDHYYTEIDESVVNTSDLFVQTSDVSVFTLNTNVVSNYGDVYIIACDSVEEARYAYSYYVGKVDNITDLANVISIASEDNEDDVADLSNSNNGEDAIANLNEIDVNDYSGYIALIDTGANADVNFSVVGDNTTDSNGHGTAMLGYIREENPDAKVMSIKVFDDSNTTNAANVYAGIKLAIESNVSIINLSLVGADIETNAIVKEVIQEAIDKGIIVIGAAGNYNLSATRYIPGCVNDVITVGAVNEDGTKYATSNYNADLYVIATSTSEAAARYSGIYTSGNSSDKVYSAYIIPTPTVTPTATVTPVPTSVEDDFVDDRDFDTYSADMAELGISVTTDENGNYVYNIVEDNFEIAATQQESINNLGTISSTPNLANYYASGHASGTDYGTCSFTDSDDSGKGTVSSFVSLMNTPGDLTINDFGRDLTSVCSRYWGEDQSRGALPISGDNVSCFYESSYTISYDSNTYTVVFDIRLSQRPEMTSPYWSLTSGSTNYKISSDVNGNSVRYLIAIGGTTLATDYVPVAAWQDAQPHIVDEITSYITSYINAEYSGSRGIHNIGPINTSIGNHSVSYNYYTSSDTQVFRAQLIAQQGSAADTITTNLSIHKVFSNNTSQVIPNAAFIVSGNSADANTAATNYVTTYDLVDAVYSAARPGSNSRYSDLLGKLRWVDAALQGDERTATISLVYAFTSNEQVSWDLDALGSALLDRPWTHSGTGWDTVDEVLIGVLNSQEFINKYYSHSSIPSGTSIIYTDNNGIALNPIVLGTITSNSPTTAEQTYYYREAQSNRIDADTDTNLYRVTISATGTYAGNNLTEVTYDRSVYNETTGALLYRESGPDSQDIGIRVGNSSENTDFADNYVSTREEHRILLELRTNKVDDQSNPARGATFIVYDDASCTSNHAVGTMTLSGNNTYTYNFGALDLVDGVANSFSTKEFTYYIMETSPATQVLINGTWQNTNFDANNTVYSITFTWNPNNDTISGQSATGGTVTSSLDSSTITVTATFGTSNGNTVNDIFGSITINKVEEANHSSLADAEFTIYNDVNENGTYDENVDTVYAVRTTTSTGIISLEHIPRGQYLVKETAAPEYYEVDPNYYVVTISHDKLNWVVDNITWAAIEGVTGEFINHNPIVGTTLTDVATVEHVGVNTGTAHLVDVVEYNGLHVGETYVMEGVLYDKTTGEIYLDAEGNEVRNSVTFTPEAESGTVEVPFDFPVEQKVISVVAAEKVRHENEDKYVGIHYDLTDENQEVDFPAIHTTLISTVTEEHIAPNDGTITLTDTVTYENIVPGLEYVMRGTLMVKETGEVFVDANNNPITSQIEFTPNSANGTVDITFTFDSALLEDGITLVAFESLIIVVDDSDVVITTHNDINDVDQTVNIPNIHTTFFDRDLADVDDFDNATVGENVTLVDTVHYEDIIPGLEYTLYGTIMIKETNLPLTDSEGNIIEITKTFTPTTATGDIEVEFTVNTAELKGKTLVAFETLEYNGITLVVHNDINDNDQTVHVPDVHTTAVDSVDNDKIIDGESHEQTIIDAVAYTNLVPGRTYTVTGKLVVKKDYAEGEEYEYVKDADGNIITSSTTFTPTTANGSVDVIFTIDASIYAGEQIVVFEEVYSNNRLIITHNDINDVDQTIEISLLLHVKIAKADKDNVAYYLKDAEITIFNADGTIAYDINGNPCVGITNENGEVEFTLVYDRENTYYAQETKAPAGYSINPEKFEITPTSDRESEGVCLIPVTILDTIIIIPPKTGDNMNFGLYIVLTVLSTCGLAGGCFYFFKRRKKKHNA